MGPATWAMFGEPSQCGEAHLSVTEGDERGAWVARGVRPHGCF